MKIGMLIPATLLAISVLTGPALSSSAMGGPYKDCTCATAFVKGQPVANLSQPVGSVLYSGGAGYTKATKPVILNNGSVVAVGAGSSARVTSGTGCDVGVDGNSLASVSTPEGPAGKVCIKISELKPGAFSTLPGANSAAAAGGAGAGFLNSAALGAGLVTGTFALGAGVAAISR